MHTEHTVLHFIPIARCRRVLLFAANTRSQAPQLVLHVVDCLTNRVVVLSVPEDVQATVDDKRGLVVVEPRD